MTDKASSHPTSDKAEAFLNTVASLLQKIVCTDGSLAVVSRRRTDYVAAGCHFEVCTPVGKYPLWLGINGPRLFFITYVSVAAEEAREKFSFCFGNAGKIGWDFNYETSLRSDFVSIWGTCMTDVDKQFAAPSLTTFVGENRTAEAEITDHGRFWATDIALMVQSFVRVCERHALSAPEGIDPAPL